MATLVVGLVLEAFAAHPAEDVQRILDCARKSVYLERTHLGTGSICKIHTETS